MIPYIILMSNSSFQASNLTYVGYYDHVKNEYTIRYLSVDNPVLFKRFMMKAFVINKMWVLKKGD